MKLPVHVAPSEDGVIVIRCLNLNTQMRFVGASCIASVKPGADDLDSVTLSVCNNQPAVVALSTTTSCTPFIDNGGIMKIHWDGGKLIVDRDKDFFPPADRLAQVNIRSGDFSVTTHGQMFSTCVDSWEGQQPELLAQKREGLLGQGMRIVNGDANLLCRFLVDQATFEELEACASSDLRTAEQIQLGNQMRQIADLLDERREMIRENDAVLGRARREIEGLKGQLKKVIRTKWKRLRERPPIRR